MIKAMECEIQERGSSDPKSGEIVSEEVTLEELVRRCRNGDRDNITVCFSVISASTGPFLHQSDSTFQHCYSNDKTVPKVRLL